MPVVSGWCVVGVADQVRGGGCNNHMVMRSAGIGNSIDRDRKYVPFWLLVLTGVFGKWIFQMGMGLLVYHQPYFVNPLEFSWIFAGVIVLLTSDILRWGCELQEFSDETL